MSGALNFTGASLCAKSYYLPRAYNAPLGGALVLYFLTLCKLGKSLNRQHSEIFFFLENMIKHCMQIDFA